MATQSYRTDRREGGTEKKLECHYQLKLTYNYFPVLITDSLHSGCLASFNKFKKIHIYKWRTGKNDAVVAYLKTLYQLIYERTKKICNQNDLYIHNLIEDT